MQFDPALLAGVFLRRYKRFFADVELDGRTVVAHCPNTGSLRGCLREGAPVMLAPAANPARKLRYTWTLIHLGDSWVGVDTALATPLVHEAIAGGALPELAGYPRTLPEVRYGVEGRSRIDLLLSRGGRPVSGGKRKRTLYEGDERIYVEVKNTTLVRDRVAQFPDAATVRGRKHLRELMHVVEQGHRAAMVYSVQREDCEAFAPADDIDPAYGSALREAMVNGVEVYALGGRVTPEGVCLHRRLPLIGVD